jgi:hypothetical protein
VPVAVASTDSASPFDSLPVTGVQKTSRQKQTRDALTNSNFYWLIFILLTKGRCNK